ncbi:MAG: sodium:calcium antiporter [Verrucomicrobiota bacterium]
MYWLYFAILSVIVVLVGSRLSLMADSLANRFKLSRTWVGLLMLSVITSLPEASTTIGALVKAKSPDLALGNTFGSNVFNLTIIGFCDFMFRRGGILRRTDMRNGVAAACTLPVIGLMLLSLLYPWPMSFGPLNFGVGSVVVFVVALALFSYLQRFEASQLLEREGGALPGTADPSAEKGTGLLIMKFVFASVIVVASGILLAVTGKQLADVYGLDRSFVGTLLLALATSLPEGVVGYTAVKMGSYDLVFGTIMGSNIFNILLISFADFMYTPEALGVGNNLGWEHIFTGIMSLLSTALVLIVLLSKSSRPSRRRVAPESWILVGLYLACIAGLYFGWFSRPGL